MALRRRPRSPSARPLRRMRTARMRLTLLYSGLFLLLGTTVIVVIVVVTGQSPLIVHVRTGNRSVAPVAIIAHAVPRVLPNPSTQLKNVVGAQRSAD